MRITGIKCFPFFIEDDVLLKFILIFVIGYIYSFNGEVDSSGSNGFKWFRRDFMGDCDGSGGSDGLCGAHGLWFYIWFGKLF